MAHRVGIFVCGCRGVISEIIDPAKVLEGLARVKKSVGVKLSHHCLCGPEGKALIIDSIKENELDCLLLAACPRDTHEEVFQELAREAGLPPEMVLRLDLREGCALAHWDNPGAASVKAINLIRMYSARARLMLPLTPSYGRGAAGVLVVGGGLAGLTAAGDLAGAGLEVTVIEKEAGFGGRVAQLNKVFPRMCDAVCGVSFLFDRLKESAMCQLLSNTELTGLTGSPGRFEATLLTAPRYVDETRCTGCGECQKVCPVEIPDEYDFGLARRKAVAVPRPLASDSSIRIDREACPAGCRECEKICPGGAIDLGAEAVERKLRFGAVIVATGWEPYQVEKVPRLGLGRYPGVITNMQMERLTATDGPTGGKIVREDGTPVDTVAFIQCAGSRDVAHQRWCSTICCTAALKQALYVREALPGASVFIFYTDLRTYGDYEDIYRKAQEMGVVFVRSSPAEVARGNGGKLLVKGEDTLLGRNYQVEAGLVVLAAGMKPGKLPECLEKFWGSEAIKQYGLVSEAGFLAGHKQCFPFESGLSGFFTAGCCQGPMDMAGAARSAAGAAGKVLQLLSRQVELNPYIPVIEKARCDKCKRCIEECPYGVMFLDEEGFPGLDPAYCRGCQVCMGACARRCLTTQGFNIRQMIAMVTAKIKEPAPGEPTILAFMCENDAYRAVVQGVRQGVTFPPNIHIIPVRCLGTCNAVLIQDALPLGVDGFIFAGCHSGECHYLQGVDRAEERFKNMTLTMQDMMIEPERVMFLRMGIRDYSKFAEETRRFVERLKSLGPNPFKNVEVIKW